MTGTLFLDPVLLEVMNQQVASIAEQMSAHLQRASRSMYVKEAADFGVGLADLGGKMFAYPRGANMFSIDRPCGALIEAVPEVGEGDVIFSNDPFLSKGLSTHLPDLHMLRPLYYRGRIVCYAWAFIHFTDMGGSVPSSIAPLAHRAVPGRYPAFRPSRSSARDGSARTSSPCSGPTCAHPTPTWATCGRCWAPWKRRRRGWGS